MTTMTKPSPAELAVDVQLMRDKFYKLACKMPHEMFMSDAMSAVEAVEESMRFVQTYLENFDNR